MALPYTSLILTATVVAALGASHWWVYSEGQSNGKEGLLATQAAEAKVARDTYDETSRAIVDVLSKQRPIYKTINNEAIEKHYENTIYRDCKLPSDGVQRINAAAGASRPEQGPAGPGEVRGAVGASDPGPKR